MPSDSSQSDRPRRSRWKALVLEPLQRQLAEHARILRPGMRLTIGSAPEADLRLNLQAVEPIHCVIVTDVRGVYLQQWNDRTWWNDKPLDLAPRSPHRDLPELNSGDRLAIGPIEFRLRRPEPEDWLIERNREQSERLRASLANLETALQPQAAIVATARTPADPANPRTSGATIHPGDPGLPDATTPADATEPAGTAEPTDAAEPADVAAADVVDLADDVELAEAGEGARAAEEVGCVEATDGPKRFQPTRTAEEAEGSDIDEPQNAAEPQEVAEAAGWRESPGVDVPPGVGGPKHVADLPNGVKATEGQQVGSRTTDGSGVAERTESPSPSDGDALAEPPSVEKATSGALEAATGVAEVAPDAGAAVEEVLDGRHATPDSKILGMAAVGETLQQAIREVEEDRRRLHRAEADLARELEELQRRRRLLQREWEALHAERRALERERSEVATARAELLRLKRELQEQWGTCDDPMARWQAMQVQEVRLREREQELNRREAALVIAGQRLLQASPVDRPLSDASAEDEARQTGPHSNGTRDSAACGPTGSEKDADAETPRAAASAGGVVPSAVEGDRNASGPDVRRTASKLAEWLHSIDEVLSELAAAGFASPQDDNRNSEPEPPAAPLETQHGIEGPGALAGSPASQAEHAGAGTTTPDAPPGAAQRQDHVTAGESDAEHGGASGRDVEAASAQEPSETVNLPDEESAASARRSQATPPEPSAVVTGEPAGTEALSAAPDAADSAECAIAPGRSGAVEGSPPAPSAVVARVADSAAAEDDSLLIRLEGSVRELLGLTARVASVEETAAERADSPKHPGADDGTALDERPEHTGKAALQPPTDAAEAPLAHAPQTEPDAVPDIDAWLDALDEEPCTPTEADGNGSVSILDDHEPAVAEAAAPPGNTASGIDQTCRGPLSADTPTDTATTAPTSAPAVDARDRRPVAADVRQKRRRLMIRGWWNLLAAVVSLALVWASLRRPLTPDDTALRWLAGVFGALSFIEAVQSFSAGVRLGRDRSRAAEGRTASPTDRRA